MNFERGFVAPLAKRLKTKTPFIQVVYGPRQVGKTTGVLQLQKHLSDPIVYASADEVLNPSESWILENWQKALLKSPRAVLILDEIQRVPEWSLVLKRLFDTQKRELKTNLKIVVLGSSSLSLQKGLSESLAGRYEAVPVPHWNFFESQKIKKMTLDDYLQFGGYPGSYKLLSDKARWRAYLQQMVVEAVLGRDILAFATVKNPALFRQAFEIACQYPAQEISLNKLLGQLQTGGNVDLIKNYLNLYRQAFLIETLEKYSEKAVLRKSSSPKILPLCPALTNFQSAQPLTPEKRGRLFELAVGAELLHLNGQLYYWRDTDRFEVDYVFIYEGRTFAIEVKSGRKKSTAGIEAFCKKFKNVTPLFITPENFLEWGTGAAGFFKKI